MQRARRINFVNRFFYPDHSATSQMLSDLAFALAKRGWSVRVITSRQRYDDPSARLPKRERIDGVDVVRLSTARFGRSNLLGRSFDYLSFYLAAAGHLAFAIKNKDLVVAKTDPPMLSVIATPIARFRGAKVVNWLQDLFPEVADALAVGRNPIVRMGLSIARRLRDASLRRSDINVAIGERMAERLCGLGIEEQRVVVLPNWADGRYVSPVAAGDNSLRAQWGLKDAFVVAYSGNLGRAHEIETMLQAMAHLRNDDAHETAKAKREIKWLFIGAGALMPALQDVVAKAGFKNVNFKPYQPRDLISESLSVGDVHIVSLQPKLEGLIVPSKFYGIAAVGRPTIFIGDCDGEIPDLLRAHQAGFSVQSGDGQALAKAILKFRDDETARTEAGANARVAFTEAYDLPIVVEKWDTLLRRHSKYDARVASDLKDASPRPSRMVGDKTRS